MKIGELTVGRGAGILAALLWAVFPWFSQWAITYIWEISLTALLLTSLFWYALRLLETRAPRTWVGFGALWGFTLLVNPALMTFMLVSLLWLAYHRRRLLHSWRKPVLLAATTCLVVISPWLIRNRIAFGQWVFLRTNFAFEVWNANYHGGSGRDWGGRHPTASPAQRAEYLRLGELSYMHEKSVEVRQFIKQYPGEFALLTAKRFLMFWDGDEMRAFAPAAPFWLSWSFPVFSLLLLPSLVLACRRRIRGRELFLGALLLYPAPYYLTSGQVRFRHAVEPLMLLLISFLFVALFESTQAKPRWARQQISSEIVAR